VAPIVFQELDCLEDNLDVISSSCRDVITKYSEEVDENPEISELFVHACKTFWNKYCQVWNDWIVHSNDNKLILRIGW